MLKPAEDDLGGGWIPRAASTESANAVAAKATTYHRNLTTKSARTRKAASPRSSYARLVACIDAASALTGDGDDGAVEIGDELSESHRLSLQKSPSLS